MSSHAEALRIKFLGLIACKERPCPGAQLRFTDTDGMRGERVSPSNCGTAGGHGPTPRSVPRGPRPAQLPLRDATQNPIWLEAIQIAVDLLA